MNRFINWLENVSGIPKNEHYQKRLCKLLRNLNAIAPNKKRKGFACHHIVPRAWANADEQEKDNMIFLSFKSHFVIHHLMKKSFPKDFPMMVAFHGMVNGWGHYHDFKNKITAKEYARLNEEFHLAPRSQSHKKKISVALKSFYKKTDFIKVNNGQKTIRIHPSEWTNYENAGWKLGGGVRGKDSKKSGKVWITDGIHKKFIKPEDISNFPDWRLGQPPHTQERTEKISKANKGKVSARNTQTGELVLITTQEFHRIPNLYEGLRKVK